MKKLLAIIAVLIGIAALAGAAQYSFLPVYSIVGNVNGITAAPSEGQTVVFFRDMTSYDAGLFSSDKVGAAGSSKTANKFLLNATSNPQMPALAVGGKYYAAVVQDANGYGAGPVEVTVSGTGYDLAPDMVMAMGAGVGAPGAAKKTEPAPGIKLWFDKRLYQPALVTTDNPFIVSSNPNISVQVEIADPYTLATDVADYSIIVDQGTAAQKSLALKAENITRKVYATGTAPEENKISAMSLVYNLSEPLADGSHVFAATARSSGALGTASLATYLATVEVLGGPVRLIGTPITFPSPYSISKNGTVTIQYELSKNANIQIVFADISGRLTRNFTFQSGQEGGSAGINKVTWDGRTDRGTLAGNGIYLGTIISRDDGRKLGTVKLPIVD